MLGSRVQDDGGSAGPRGSSTTWIAYGEQDEAGWPDVDPFEGLRFDHYEDALIATFSLALVFALGWRAHPGASPSLVNPRATVTNLQRAPFDTGPDERPNAPSGRPARGLGAVLERAPSTVARALLRSGMYDIQRRDESLSVASRCCSFARSSSCRRKPAYSGCVRTMYSTRRSRRQPLTWNAKPTKMPPSSRSTR